MIVDFKQLNYFSNNYPWMKNVMGNRRLKSVVFQETLRNKQKEAFYFNEKGMPLKMYYSAMFYDGLFKKRETYFHEFDYNDKDKIVESRSYTKKHKLIHSTNLSYFSDNRCASVIQSYKGRPQSETNYTYQSDSSLFKNEKFKLSGGKKKLLSYYEYAYYPDKKIKSTKFYRKNKLKHTWNYDCDTRGKLQKKDTTSVCTQEGSDQRGRKVVTEHFSANKKKEQKNISYYKTINGKEVLNEFESYEIKNGKERLIFTTHYPDSLEPFHSFKTYGKKGHLVFENTTRYFVYTEKIKLLSSHENCWYKPNGKLVIKRSETFNEKGLPQLATVSGPKTNSYKLRIEYIFTNENEFKINHYRKNKLKKSFSCSISTF